MRIEVSIAKTTALPNGALEALNNELSRRIAEQFPAIDSQVSVRYATGNQLSVFGALKEDKDRISEILQETWESADDWFVHDLSCSMAGSSYSGLLPHCAFLCRVAPAFFSPPLVQNIPDYSA